MRYVRQTNWADYRAVDPAEKALCYFFAKAQGYNPEDQDRDGLVWTAYRAQAQTALREMRAAGLKVVPA